MHLNCAEVQLKIYLIVYFNKYTLLVHFKYFAFNDLYYSKVTQPSSKVTLKTDFILNIRNNKKSIIKEL